MVVKEYKINLFNNIAGSSHIKESSAGRGFIYGRGKGYGNNLSSKFIFDSASVRYGDGTSDGAGYKGGVGEGESIT